MNTIAPIKYFIYARKSTESEDRQARSIGDQLAELRELAAKEHLLVVETFIESRTAKTPGRPVFNDMLARMEMGEASGLLVWAPDRLARNSLDGGRIIYLVDTGKVRDIKSPTYRFDATPQGKFMLSIAFGQSKYYVDSLSENINRGIRQKLKRGVWPQLAPLGYLNDRVSKTIMPDPERSPFIRKAFELYATGRYTFAEVHDAVNALGLTARRGRMLSVSNYQYLLQNPIYFGIIRYHGELYPGTHEPIITKELFNAVQAAMRRRSKPKGRSLKPYLYRGLFHCGECGRTITTETQKGHNYLRCTKWTACSQPYVREEAVTEQIVGILQKISLPADWADWMLAELEREQATNTIAVAEQLQAFRDELAGYDRKLDRLMAVYLDEGLSLPEYRTTKNDLVLKKHECGEQLATLERNRSSALEPLITRIQEAKTAGFLAESADTAEQCDFFRKIVSNPKVAHREVDWEPRGAWKTVVAIGRLARQQNAASCDAAFLAGELDQISLKRRERDSNPRYRL